ncbi:Na/Pi cotransporter family protein [Campylobacter sp. RM12327]|uniref:Na/Pi cotransporter family protein n=1 Tax=Campylobacter sputorum TaxID=206 RepID=UPI000B775375|nr:MULTISPECIES: Na/Pi symporter [Campylobacter]ASM40171.1 Na+/Pi-cotransporter [Campylobacter sputorum]MBE7358844.1 Na/Pi cotransporter family protein [Campylobacter sp. RM11302]MBF6670129.1 Na/Pi cotransporter family protein [Campylobacter sp. RM12327]MBF6675273.1 Na/Pi cotransporter family protein [Campylobacter sp. RM13538]MBF6676468.1 Na/Pi cotransporter family protein [Campylobacter sp. RM12321]
MIKKFFNYSVLVVFFMLIFNNKNFLTICFGICLFLYSLEVLSNSFKMITGSWLEIFLKKATKNNTTSFLFGLISTAIMQSSGLVTVLCISFLSAELITLLSGLFVIFGTNIGTTTGAWLIAGIGLKIDIANYAMPIVIFGVIFTIMRENAIKGIGFFLISIGLILIAIMYMKSGFESTKENIDLAKYSIEGLKGVIIYVIVGTLITALMQSSHATLMLTLAALANNQIVYENALAIAIGSNVGSTIMAVIGSLNANTNGKRLMLGHVIVNIVVAIIAIILFNPFVNIVDISSKFFGIKNNDYMLKLSLFHTYFNFIIMIIFAPFAKHFVNLLEKLVKQKDYHRNQIDKAIYLNQDALTSIESSKKLINKEIRHLVKNTYTILAKSISISSNDINNNQPDEIIKLRQTPIKIDFKELYAQRFKPIYNEIIDFSTKAQNFDKTQKFSEYFMTIRKICLYLANTLKNMELIHKNIYYFINHDNEFIKLKYDLLRLNLTKTLKLTNEILLNDSLDEAKEHLITLKSLKKSCNDNSFDAINNLLNNEKITSSMATSLMNDSSIAWDITKDFIKISKLILLNQGKFDQTEVTKMLDELK